MGKHLAGEDTLDGVVPARPRAQRSWIEWLFGRRLSQKQEEQQEPSIPLPEPEKSSRGWIFNRRPYHKQIDLQKKKNRDMNAEEFIRQQKDKAEEHKKKPLIIQFFIEYFNINQYAQYQELAAYYQKKEEEVKQRSLKSLPNNLKDDDKFKFLEQMDFNRVLDFIAEIDIEANPALLLTTVAPLCNIVNTLWNRPNLNYCQKSHNSISIIGVYTNRVAPFKPVEEGVSIFLKPIPNACKELFESMYSIFDIPDTNDSGFKLKDAERKYLLCNKFVPENEENIRENPQAGEQLIEAIHRYGRTISEIVNLCQPLSPSSYSSSSNHRASSPLFQAPSPRTFFSSSSSSNPPNANAVSKLREGVPEEPCQAFGEKWIEDSAAWLGLLSKLPPLNAPNRMTYEALLKKKLRIAQRDYHPDKNPQNLEAAEIAFKWIFNVYEKALLEGKSEEDSKEWYRNYMAELAELRRGWAEVREVQDEIAQGHDEIRKGHDEIRKEHQEIYQTQSKIRKTLDELEENVAETTQEMNKLQSQMNKMEIEIEAVLNEERIKKENTSSDCNPPDAVVVSKLREGVPQEPYQAFGEKWREDSVRWLDLLSQLPSLDSPDRIGYETSLRKEFRVLALRYHSDKNPQNLKAAESAFNWIQEVYNKALLTGMSAEDSKEWYRNYMAELAELRRNLAELRRDLAAIAKGQDEIAKGQDKIAKGQDEIAKEQDEIRQEQSGMQEKCNQIDRKQTEMRKTLEQLDRIPTKDKTEKADGMLRGMEKLADEMLTRIERRIEGSAIHSLFFQRNEKEQKILRQQRRLSAPASVLELERSRRKGF